MWPQFFLISFDTSNFHYISIYVQCVSSDLQKSSYVAP